MSGVAKVPPTLRADGRLALRQVNPRLPEALVLTAAAGANLAALALPVPFREVAIVRYLAEQVVTITDCPMSRFVASALQGAA